MFNLETREMHLINAERMGYPCGSGIKFKYYDRA
jgi:hypothetical protein